MYQPVTDTEVQKAVQVSNIVSVNHHTCAICGVYTAYHFSEGNAYYDSGCDCTSMPTRHQSIPWWRVADYINDQPVDTRASVALEFGVSLTSLD